MSTISELDDKYDELQEKWKDVWAILKAVKYEDSDLMMWREAKKTQVNIIFEQYRKSTADPSHKQEILSRAEDVIDEINATGFFDAIANGV